MRVCMLAYTFYESDNRVMRYAETLADRGDHVDVIALREQGSPYQEVLAKVHLYRIQKRVINESGPLSYLWRVVSFLFRSAWLVTRLHLQKPYDLIHVHSVPDFEVFAALVPKILGAKVILDIHDIVPEFYASKFNTSKKSPLFKSLVGIEKLSIAFSEHVIISNHLWQKRLESRSVRPEKCTVIINYPNPAIFYPRKWQNTNNRFIMMYPGTINWHQGLDIAVQAFDLIKDKAPSAHFFIYGKGPNKASLIDLIEKSGLTDRIKVFDPLPLRKIAGIMAAADLGIIPKRNDQFGGEAFSTKILEFMASNVPVIVSRTRIDKYYFDESIVTFFEPENAQSLAEAMLRLIEDKEHRARQAENALRFSQINNWKLNNHIYQDLTNALISRRQQQPSQ